MNKLNLMWISEVIGEDWKQWQKGDMVEILGQTGTGKTNFIKKLIRKKVFAKVLYLCNRIDLKRQVKKDLIEIEEGITDVTLEELDKRVRIGNVVVTSYHAVANNKLNVDFLDENNIDIDDFDYIICDECHFFRSDSSFNNRTHLAFECLLEQPHYNSVVIFISATIGNLDKDIRQLNKKMNESGGRAEFEVDGSINVRPYKIFSYDTNRDYSYIDYRIFKNLSDIVTLIKNDKSEEKWIIFVRKKDDGLLLQNELGDLCSFNFAGSDNEETENVINNSKFNKKVFITTKAMDNGVNFKDTDVKNVVLMATDEVTFLQELGRIRINIQDAREIKLYLKMQDKRMFYGLRTSIYDKLRYKIGGQDENDYMWEEFYNDEYEEFKKYCSHNNFNRKLFYTTNDGNYKLNTLYRDFAEEQMKAYKYIEELFDATKGDRDEQFAFIKIQLDWLGLKIDIDEMEERLIIDVASNEEVNSLKQYLDSLVGQKLFKEEQQELSNKIIKELVTIKTKTDYRTKILKPTTIENILRNDLNLEYIISNSKRETKGTNKGKRYIEIFRVL